VGHPELFRLSGGRSKQRKMLVPGERRGPLAASRGRTWRSAWP
jgi:hypothetical protein